MRATIRSARPSVLNLSAARRPWPRASRPATSGAAMPTEMSPRPAGSANRAGRWPSAMVIRKTTPAAADAHRPARWHFRLDGADYTLENGGQQ